MRHELHQFKTKLLRAGLEPGHPDAQLVWAAQTLSIMLATGLVVSLPAALLYLSCSWLLFFAHIASALGFAAAYLRFHRQPDPAFTVRACAFNVFALVLVVTIVTGGIESPAIGWFVPPALAVALILGSRAARGWFGGAALAVAAVFGGSVLGWLPASPVPANVAPVAEAFYAITLVLAIGWLFSRWLARQRTLTESLHESLASAHADTRTARLFAESAAAANGSPEFAPAARRCLELVCAHEAWRAGHVWLTAADGVLRSTDISWQRPDNTPADPIEFTPGIACPDAHSARIAHDTVTPAIGLDLRHDARLAACSRPPQCVLAWPVDLDGAAEIVLEFFSDTIITPDDDLHRILGYIGTQLAHVRRRVTIRDHTETVAFTDPVTGLPNRTGFEQLFAQKLKECARNDSRLALMFVDLDGFKRINDSLGHAVGDRLLRSIGRRLEQRVRESDIAAKLEPRHAGIAARFGGDEFTLVLAEVDDAKAVADAARRVLDVLAEPVDIGFQDVNIGASIGVAMYPDDGKSSSDLMRLADAAMYEAKTLPGNQFRFATPALNDAIVRRVWVEAELHRAIRRDELKVRFAPIQAARTGRIIANELSLRWLHSDGEIAPEEFLPVAESSGLVAKLGYWTIEKACAAISAARWNGDAGRMCVDISLLNLQQPNFVETVAAIIARHGTPRAMLEFEFADTSAILKHETCRAHIWKLHEMGIRIVLDRFGAGYSSLIDLARLPVWRIKLERAFIEAVTIADDNQSISRAIIAMAHSMGIETTVYGVETAADANALRKLGCDALQGNWVGRPGDEPHRKRIRPRAVAMPTIIDTNMSA